MLGVKTDFSRRELRWFGPLFGFSQVLIATIVWRRLALPRAALFLVVLATGVILVYYARPRWQPVIYRGWLHSVAPLGWAVSHLLMALVFYGLVTPIGLCLRLCGRRPLTVRPDRQATTYWESCAPRDDDERHFRQF